MTIRFLFLVILITSCSRVPKEQNPTLNDDSVKSEKTKKASIDSSAIKISLKTDSINKKMFWEAVVVPILKKDRKTVLGNMDFPVLGYWTQMMEMNKGAEEATRDDFAKVYDRFFNSDFLGELSKTSMRDINVNRDGSDVWYSFVLTKPNGDSESSVILVFLKFDDSYKLKKIGGAGGNFFAR